MKKLLLQLIPALAARNFRGKSVIGQFILAFTLSSLSYSGMAQVAIAPAGGGTAICSRTAIGGSTPGCTTLGTITITETNNGDFGIGADNITLSPPAGWQFCVGSTPTVTVAGGGDVPSVSTVGFSATSMPLNFTAAGITHHDVITITGLQVQALSVFSVPGYIYASSASGVAGIATGTAGSNFGNLALLPGTITGPSNVCVGDSIILTSSPGPVTWSSGSLPTATVVSISPTTAYVIGHAPGTVTITATIGGCSTTFNVNVNANPAPISGLLPAGGPYHMCAWYDTLNITDASSGGLYNSFGITVANLTGGAGKVYAHAPGTTTITYTLPSGCFTTSTVIVDPLPQLIQSPPYKVCQGSTDTLSDASTGGIWSKTDLTGSVTIGSTNGVVTGVTPGTSLIIYTIPGGFAGGCVTDTTMTVLALPAPIALGSGTSELCSGTTISLSDGTAGGTWHSVNMAVAIVTPTTPGTVVVTGVTDGISTISYTLLDGCAATVVVTVDALPDSISGPDSVCVGDSIHLANLTPGGRWISGSTTVATIDSMTGTLTGVGHGVTIITYFINPGHCIATYTVTVDSLPAPIIGADSVCVGGTVHLTESGPGIWSSLVIPHITYVDPTGILTGLGNGVDTVVFTNVSGCKTRFVVTVNPLPPAILGLDSLCLGDSTLLTDITTSGGTWVSSDPAVVAISSSYPDSAWIHGVASGVANITYTTPSGCYTILSVTVHALPGPIFSDTSVCVGQTVILHDILPGGVWSIASTTTATIGSSSGIVTGAHNGVTIVYYTAPGGCSTHELFYVNVLDPIMGPNQVCQGDSILYLTDSAVGGIWTSSSLGVATVHGSGSIVDTAVVVGLSAGTTIISYDEGSGCVATYSVTVNPVSNIVLIGSPQICAGDSFVIFDAVAGGHFSTNDSSIAIAYNTSPSAGYIKGIGAGVAIITYTLPTGCSAALQVTIEPLPNPIFGTDSVCVGDLITLQDTGSVTGTWSVYNTNASINPLTGVLLGLHAGLDTVAYTTSSGCFRIYPIKVNELTGIFGTTNQVCVNGVIQLSDTTHGSVGIWSLAHQYHGATHIDSIVGTAPGIYGSTVVDSGITAGVDTVLYHIVATGCTTGLIVTINPLPTVTGIDSVCEGATVVDTGHAFGSGSGPGTWVAYNGNATATGTADSTVLIHGVTAGIDTIKYTLSTGCITTFVVTVNHTPSPIVGDSTICLGHTTLYTNPSVGGYWHSADSFRIRIDSLTGHAAAWDSLGRDTIFYILPVSRCSSQLVVTVEPIPVITDSQSHHTWICIGGSDTLYANGAGPSGTYTWAPSFGLTATTGTWAGTGMYIVVSPTVTTTYTVTGTTKWGCDSTNTITVLVDSTFLHIRVTGRDSICRGDSDIIMAAGRDSTYFNWHPATGILGTTIADTIKVSPDTTTTYTGVAIDDIGCKDSVVFKVTVNPLPIIKVTPNPAVLCYGTPLQLHASTLNTDSASTKWSWSPNLFISNDSVYDPIVNDTSNLVYRVTAITKFGCIDSFKVKVSVLDTNVNKIVADTNICIGSSAQLLVYSHSVTSNLDEPTYVWSPTRGLNNPNIYDPVATPDTTTTYSVHIHENACFDTTLKVTVFVQPYPQISISPGSETIIAGTPTQLTATVTNTPVLYYAWAPGNTLSCDSCLNPVATPRVRTTYTVIVSSIYHCIDQDTVTLNMVCDNSQIFIPNTFTPNGDGVNDRFFVSGKGITLITLFQVYNRWGQLLFEEHNIPPNDPGYGWDGTFKGLVLEPDVFVYIVKAKCELGGDDFKYKGDISIVR